MTRINAILKLVHSAVKQKFVSNVLSVIEMRFILTAPCYNSNVMMN